MNDILMKTLEEEKSVFEVFSINKEITKNCVAFATPESNEFPRWNIVYPSKHNYIYQDYELEKCLDFYKNYNLDGHVLTFEDKWERYSVQTEEYFYLDKKLTDTQTSLDVKEFSLISDNDLELFCKIVQQAFDFSNKTKDFFQSKMALLSKKSGSKFWMVYYMGQACGVASVFKTKNNTNFMFNGAVLPEFQRKNICNTTINYCISRAEVPLYTCSNNDIVRKKILPRVGFISIGIVHVIPIHIYKEKIKSM